MAEYSYFEAMFRADLRECDEDLGLADASFEACSDVLERGVGL